MLKESENQKLRYLELVDVNTSIVKVNKVTENENLFKMELEKISKYPM